MRNSKIFILFVAVYIAIVVSSQIIREKHSGDEHVLPYNSEIDSLFIGDSLTNSSLFILPESLGVGSEDNDSISPRPMEK